tara:strand:- start:243 stop:995 length:753 start_codon:yes stop_codon:yes gene_type:complete
MNLISIIIPTKDRLKFLKRAVDSIIAQTYTNWELFIINDSKEDLLFSSCDTRIHKINNSNKPGANGARNTGIDLSTGKYIAFLDDDDSWHPTKLYKQVAIMDSGSALMCYSGRNIIIKKKNTIRYSYHSLIFSSSFTLFIHNYIGTTSSILLRNKFNNNIKFDEKIILLQDYDFYLSLAAKGEIVGLPEPLVNYYSDKSIKHISENNIFIFSSFWKIFLKQIWYKKLMIIIPFIITILQKFYRNLYYKYI